MEPEVSAVVWEARVEPLVVLDMEELDSVELDSVELDSEELDSEERDSVVLVSRASRSGRCRSLKLSGTLQNFQVQSARNVQV